VNSDLKRNCIQPVAVTNILALGKHSATVVTSKPGKKKIICECEI
jgi:hypothetical protein